jgi:hypothetical protein
VADYSRRMVTTVRVEYTLPNPTNAAEFGKAYSAAERELRGLGVDIADDTIIVEGRDEEVVLSFIRTEETSHG